jgi:hypothetical protein
VCEFFSEHDPTVTSRCLCSVAVFLALSMLTEPVVSCFFANELDPVVPRAVPALVTTFAGLCARPSCLCHRHHVVSAQLACLHAPCCRAAMTVAASSFKGVPEVPSMTRVTW